MSDKNTKSDLASLDICEMWKRDNPEFIEWLAKQASGPQVVVDQANGLVRVITKLEESDDTPTD